jgi:hypothetical protein
MNGHDPLVKSTVAARGNSDGGYDTGNNQQHHHGTESHQASFSFMRPAGPIRYAGSRTGDSMSLTLNTA